MSDVRIETAMHYVDYTDSTFQVDPLGHLHILANGNGDCAAVYAPGRWWSVEYNDE